MNETGKLLSVIVPSYNMEAYLPKCLNSLVVDDAELLQKLDVIVVNDGSKDRTSEIAHDFEKRYPGVFRVIDKPNGHYGSCINAALPLAKGEYVKVLDADDWFDTSQLARYLAFLEVENRRGELASDLVLNDFEFVDSFGGMVRTYEDVAVPAFSISDLDFSEGHDLWMHAVAYRRDNLSRIGYQQMVGVSHTDVQWIHTPMSAVNAVTYFPGCLYKYQNFREGNTSDAEGYYRTFPDLVEVTRRLVSEYPVLKNTTGPIQAQYLLNHLRYRVKRVYQVCLVDQSPLLRPGVLEEFDSFLKMANPSLYQEMELLTLSEGRLPFYYVRDWRRAGRISLRRRIYEQIRSLYGKMRRS